MWPMFVLTDPIETRLPRRTALAEDLTEGRELDGIADARAGAVGLDVADAARLDPGVRYAWRSIAACTAGLGATSSPLPWPSLLTALPRISAWIGSPSARARDNGLSSTNADALAAHVAVRPRVAEPAAAVRREHRRARVPDRDVRLQDQVHAAGQRHRRSRRSSRLWQARCTATSEEEHAVSSVRLGPRRSKA